MTIDIDDAINALLAYQQADMEGTMVLTSRQAIHEVANEIRRIRADAQPTREGKSPEWFCQWLKGFLGGIPGRDELDAFEANSIRNTLNEVVATQPPAAPVERERRCQKCGETTKGEEALVDGQIWCHPCADHSRSSAGSGVAVLPAPAVEIDETAPIMDLIWRSGDASFSIVVLQSKLVGIHCTMEPPRSNVAWTVPLPEGLIKIDPTAYSVSRPHGGRDDA